MRSFVCVLVVVAGVLAGTALAAESAIDPAAHAFANERWTKPRPDKQVNIAPRLELLASDRIKKLLAGCTVYRAHVFNPASVIAGPDTFVYALVVKDREPTYIENDAAAAEFLSLQKIKSADAEAARELVMTFADLRGYFVQDKISPEAGARDYKTTKPDDWKLAVTEEKDGWAFTCPFVTDPNIYACVQYTVRVTREGTISAAAGKRLCSRSGYR